MMSHCVGIILARLEKETNQTCQTMFPDSAYGTPTIHSCQTYPELTLEVDTWIVDAFAEGKACTLSAKAKQAMFSVLEETEAHSIHLKDDGHVFACFFAGSQSFTMRCWFGGHFPGTPVDIFEGIDVRDPKVAK